MNNTAKYLTAIACAGVMLPSALPAIALASGTGGSISATGSDNNGGAKAGNGGNGYAGSSGNGGNVTATGSENNGGASAGTGGNAGGVQSSYNPRVFDPKTYRIRPSR